MNGQIWAHASNEQGLNTKILKETLSTTDRSLKLFFFAKTLFINFLEKVEYHVKLMPHAINQCSIKKVAKQISFVSLFTYRCTRAYNCELYVPYIHIAHNKFMFVMIPRLSR